MLNEGAFQHQVISLIKKNSQIDFYKLLVIALAITKSLMHIHDFDDVKTRAICLPERLTRFLILYA